MISFFNTLILRFCDSIWFDCDCNCLVDIDCEGTCGGDTEEDCLGECGGSAEFDDCGVCNGDDSSCAVYIEIEVTTTVDESELEDMEAFEDNFCWFFD